MSISFLFLFSLSPSKFRLHTYTSLSYLQIFLYTMNQVLTENIIFFFFVIIVISLKKVECQEQIFFLNY